VSEFIETGPHAETRRLYRVRESALYVDAFGDVITQQGKYVRVLEVIDTFLNGEWRRVQTGYGQCWDAPIYEASDGRTWVMLQEMVAYSGGRWYRPLFDEPRDPALEPNEIGPRVTYIPEDEMKYKRCVNADGKPVDMEGNLL